MSACPPCSAQSPGVPPHKMSLMSSLAPRSTSIRTTSAWPASAAWCNGVECECAPCGLNRFGSYPRCLPVADNRAQARPARESILAGNGQLCVTEREARGFDRVVERASVLRMEFPNPLAGLECARPLFGDQHFCLTFQLIEI